MSLDAGREAAQEVLRQVNRVILGKEEAVREIFLALLADGHVLLEDIPGVGKTTLARAFAGALGLECHRVQLTPDVLPSDLTGFSIYRRGEERFVWQPGSVFCNLLLADELNRTSPKTQSALLEVMEERQVTAEGVTRPVPRPFLVIATENPLGSAGTQPLPESQLDRFAVSLSLGYPDFDHELAMAMEAGAGSRTAQVEQVLERAQLLEMQQAVSRVYLKETVCRYLLELVRTTRTHAGLAQGAGPRATIALVRLSRAAAWLRGRDYVTPEDVAEQFPYVAAHRVLRKAGARLAEQTVEQILQDILKTVPKPSLGGKAYTGDRP